MHQVICPDCGKERAVRAKKPWMTGEPPYSKQCKSCCQLGKEKSTETRQKLSEAVKKTQTDEVLAAKSQFRKEHPEVWKNSLVPGAGGGWNKGMTLGPRDEETKEKISETLKATKDRKKEQK